MARFCARCGTEVSENLMFCSQCGAAIAAEEPTVANISLESTPREATVPPPAPAVAPVGMQAAPPAAKSSSPFLKIVMAHLGGKEVQ